MSVCVCVCVSSHLTPSQVLWSDIGGLHDVKKRLLESVEWPLRHPEVEDGYIERGREEGHSLVKAASLSSTGSSRA